MIGKWEQARMRVHFRITQPTERACKTQKKKKKRCMLSPRMTKDVHCFNSFRVKFVWTSHATRYPFTHLLLIALHSIAVRGVLYLIHLWDELYHSITLLCGFSAVHFFNSDFFSFFCSLFIRLQQLQSEELKKSGSSIISNQQQFDEFTVFLSVVFRARIRCFWFYFSVSLAHTKCARACASNT